MFNSGTLSLTHTHTHTPSFTPFTPVTCSPFACRSSSPFFSISAKLSCSHTLFLFSPQSLRLLFPPFPSFSFARSLSLFLFSTPSLLSLLFGSLSLSLACCLEHQRLTMDSLSFFLALSLSRSLSRSSCLHNQEAQMGFLSHTHSLSFSLTHTLFLSRSLALRVFPTKTA